MTDLFDREIERILIEANLTSLSSEEYGKMIARAIAMQKVILENQRNENEKYRADIQWDSNCRQLDFDKEKLEKELQLKRTEEDAREAEFKTKTRLDKFGLTKDCIKIAAVTGTTLFLAVLTVAAEETKILNSRVGQICKGMIQII